MSPSLIIFDQYDENFQQFKNLNRSNINVLRDDQATSSLNLQTTKIDNHELRHENIAKVINFKRRPSKNLFYGDYPEFKSSQSAFVRRLPGTLIFNQWKSPENINTERREPTRKRIIESSINFLQTLLNNPSYVNKIKLENLLPNQLWRNTYSKLNGINL